ncbi:MAG: hypothetical protein FWG81_07110 [Betaproteobacteria bacterium]|nr:hypothetical protein [Betaproteobacteria bacterium]
MNDTFSASVTKYVVVALAAVLVLNLLLQVIFNLHGMPVTIGIAAGVAWLISFWFPKSLGRVPTKKECSLFLWYYGGILALAFIALLVLVHWGWGIQPNAGGLLIAFLHYLLNRQLRFDFSRHAPYGPKWQI